MDIRKREMEILTRELTEAQQRDFQSLLTQLRQGHSISEQDYSASHAFRFFRGNNMNLDKSLTAVLKNISWRKEQPLEEARKLNLKDFDFGYSKVKMGFYGTDFTGHPIRIIQPSNFDPTPVLKRYDTKSRYLFALQYLERNLNIALPLATIMANRYINGMISIIDLKDLNVFKVLMNWSIVNDYRRHAQEFQDNFPEMCTKTILINSGLFVRTLWPLAKWFIKKETRDKFVFLGADFLDELLKHTTRDNLPVSLGGTCEHDINAYPHYLNDELAAAAEQERLRLR